MTTAILDVYVLVLGADILESTDLLLPHRSHDSHHEILTLIETILELQQVHRQNTRYYSVIP